MHTCVVTVSLNGGSLGPKSVEMFGVVNSLSIQTLCNVIYFQLVLKPDMWNSSFYCQKAKGFIVKVHLKAL